MQARYVCRTSKDKKPGPSIEVFTGKIKVFELTTPGSIADSNTPRNHRIAKISNSIGGQTGSARADKDRTPTGEVVGNSCK